MDPVSGTYVAWNGREYPWPPPNGWEQRSDGRYWPVDQTPAVPAAGFSPQYGPSSASVYALAEDLPPPDPDDRVGPRPMRRRSIISLGIGALVLVMFVQFAELDILGFRVSQQDFVAFENNDEPEFFEPDFGEERELSDQSKDELLTILDCANSADEGATLTGEVWNPLDSKRSYLIAVQFFVDGARQLDGFAEIEVEPGEFVGFVARSASPGLSGSVSCEFGDVFRFTAN